MAGQGISNEYFIESIRRFHIASVRSGRTAIGLAAVAIGVALASIAVALIGIAASGSAVAVLFVCAGIVAVVGLWYALREPTN
jgi:hypothetical protein